MIAGQSAALAEREQIITEREVMIAQCKNVMARHEVVISSQHDTIKKQLKKRAGLEQQLARLLRRQYGPQKERIDPDQLMLFTAEELTQLVNQLQQGIVDSVSTDNGSVGHESAKEAHASTEAASPEKPSGRGEAQWSRDRSGLHDALPPLLVGSQRDGFTSGSRSERRHRPVISPGNSISKLAADGRCPARCEAATCGSDPGPL